MQIAEEGALHSHCTLTRHFCQHSARHAIYFLTIAISWKAVARNIENEQYTLLNTPRALRSFPMPYFVKVGDFRRKRLSRFKRPDGIHYAAEVMGRRVSRLICHYCTIRRRRRVPPPTSRSILIARNYMTVRRSFHDCIRPLAWMSTDIHCQAAPRSAAMTTFRSPS